MRSFCSAYFVEKSIHFSDFSHMWFFTYFLVFSISRVPSRSNHYLEKVGGMYTILIGTLNAPNGPP